MMHAILSDMQQPTQVAITSPLDRREHLVDEVVFARSTAGRFPARCGAVVVSAELGAQPVQRCELCAPHRAAGRRPTSLRVRLVSVVAWSAR